MLFTPGHGDPFETLMLNGLVTSLLEADPFSKINIHKEGARYVIKANTKAEGTRIVEHALTCISQDIELGSSLSKISLANRPQPTFKKAENLQKLLKELSYAKGMDVYEEFGKETHIVEKGEGRGARGRLLLKAHIPVAPVGGAHMQLSYVTIGTTGRASFKGPADYVVCPLCLLLAWTGLVRSTALIITERGGRERLTRVVYSVASPLHADQDDVSALSLIFGEKVERLDVDVPTLAAPMLAFFTGETVLTVRNIFNLLTWSYVRQGGFLGVRDFSLAPLNPLLNFVAKAKSKSPNLPRLARSLLTPKRVHDKEVAPEPELISMLAEAILYGSFDVYSIVRSLWSALELRDERRVLDRGIVEAIVLSIHGLGMPSELKFLKEWLANADCEDGTF